MFPLPVPGNPTPMEVRESPEAETMEGYCLSACSHVHVHLGFLYSTDLRIAPPIVGWACLLHLSIKIISLRKGHRVV